MKTSITRRSALFGAAIALPAVMQSGSEANAAEPKAKGKGKETPAGKEGPLHRAIHELHDTKAYLEKADHDFGGHKNQAIKDVEAALKALHAALEYELKKGA